MSYDTFRNKVLSVAARAGFKPWAVKFAQKNETREHGGRFFALTPASSFSPLPIKFTANAISDKVTVRYGDGHCMQF